MTDTQKDKLIEALKRVDAYGDVARDHVHDPMTMVLRQKALQADLMRWDDYRGHYVLTGTGRNRISGHRRAPAKIVRFQKRDSKDESARDRKT
jgi:hypothetical protein